MHTHGPPCRWLASSMPRFPTHVPREQYLQIFTILAHYRLYTGIPQLPLPHLNTSLSRTCSHIACHEKTNSCGIPILKSGAHYRPSETPFVADTERIHGRLTTTYTSITFSSTCNLSPAHSKGNLQLWGSLVITWGTVLFWKSCSDYFCSQP